MRNRASRAIVALSTILLAGCNKNIGENRGVNCFPVEAARWVYVAEKARDAPATLGPASMGTVYVDRSVSMVGYLDGETGFEKPFSDLIGTLPETLNSIGVAAQYRAFGLSLTDPIARDAGQKSLADRGFYRCNKADRSGCESRLDLVLERAAAAPSEMALIVSDLWFKNSDVHTTGIAALQGHLSKILEQNRTISIYGVPAPFKGMIYDLPGSDGKDNMQTRHDGRHPLYLMVIGTKKQALDFEKALEGSGSPRIAEAAISGQIERTHFTVDPGPLSPRSKAPLDAGSHARLRRGSVQQFDGVTIQQFTLRSGLPPKPGIKQGESASWTAPKPEHFIKNAAWEGALVPKLRFWSQRDDRCSKTSWTAPVALNGNWTSVDGDPYKRRLSLDPAMLSGRLSREGIYLVSGELERTSVSLKGPTTQWMRNWNLLPEKAAVEVERKPANFPTLNLAEFARLMENALASAAKRRGGGIVGFSILVKVEK